MIIKKWIEFIKESINGYSYGCVMVEVPVKNWEALTQIIDIDDIYEERGDSTYGIQKNPHLTLLYGLHENVTNEQVKKVFDDFDENINIEIEGVDIFENTKFDVVKFNIKKTNTLQNLFNKLSELPNSNEYPDYKPHITIAYVKSGTGKKYVNPNYKHKVSNVDEITYSKPNDDKFKFNLNNYNSDNSPILEGKGVPNSIKRLGLKISDDIINYINDEMPLEKYNLLGKEVGIKLSNQNIDDIRGLSKPYEIEFKFNFDTFNEENLKRVVYHELLHMYEIIKRISNNSKDKLQWDINNILRRVEIKYNDSFISDLCYLIYQSFDHEINARVSDVHPHLISINTTDKDTLINYLKKTKSWNYKELLQNWKPEFQKANWINLIEFIDDFNSTVLNRYPNLNFNIYKIPNSQEDCKKIINDWVKLFRKKSRYFESKLIKVVDEVIKDIKYNNNSTLVENNNKWSIEVDNFTKRDLKIESIFETFEYKTSDGQILKYDAEWKIPGSSIREMLENDLREILLEVTDLGYSIQLSGFINRRQKPHVWICNKDNGRRIPINWEEIEDSLLRIEEYLKLNGFETERFVLNEGKRLEQLYIYFDKVDDVEPIKENKMWYKTIPEILKWLKEKSKMPWVLLDTETTGLGGPKKEQLTQISAIVCQYDFKTNTFKELGQFDEKIKLTPYTKAKYNEPGDKTKWVLGFNHYGSGSYKYKEEQETIDRFFEFISQYEPCLFVAQNAQFDMQMLGGRYSHKIKNEVFDTKALIQLYFLPLLQKLAETDIKYKEMIDFIGTSTRDNGLISSSMSKIGPVLNINMQGYHDALTDCRLMMEMYQKIVDILKQNKRVDIMKYQVERIKTLRK